MRNEVKDYMHRNIEEALKKWKNATDRLPIILRGARQVGKSFIIEKFGKENFQNMTVVNFEFQPHLARCFVTLDPSEIIAKIETQTNTTITPGQTLLFIDEIQECEEAIKALRFFKEKMPELHVIAAGSLLEFVLNEPKFSFPVGRVQFMYLKPLSFEEFLISLGQFKILEKLKQVTLDKPVDDALHEHILKFVRQYLLVGGMPAVVNLFIKNASFLECRQRQEAVLKTYYTDFNKYAKKTQHKYLQMLFEQIPGFIGQRFKYSSVMPEARSRDIKLALEQLSWAGLVYRIYASLASGIPLISQKKEKIFKLLFVDVGLLQSASRMDYSAVFEENILQVNAGALAEQFVGQEFLANTDVYTEAELYFWVRDKKNSSAEVDYLLQYGTQIVPVEVKAGKTGRLKSLQQFMDEKKVNVGVRISQQSLSFERNILSIPFYLLSELPRLLKEGVL